MAVIQDPDVAANLLKVEATHKAGRTVVRPLSHGSLGQYSFGGFTGILPAALGANSEIFQFRWTSANVAVIRSVKISASVTTTFFIAGVPVQIDMVKASAWSAAGTGGTAPTLSTTLKLQTSTMGNSLIAAGDLRIATTAALGAGTKTLEANSLSAVLAGGPITASLNGTIIVPGTVLWEGSVGDGDHPLALAQNEGFVIRSVAVPATGTWQAAIQVSWTEIASY